MYPQLGSKNYGAHGGVAPKVYTLNELKGLVTYADARALAEPNRRAGLEL